MTTTRWNAEEQFDNRESLGIVLFDQYRQPIATFTGIGYPDFANAKLCAAAPDLLAACIEATAIFDNYPQTQELVGTYQVLMSAIAKATAN
jgi:hypothetical protein